MPFAALSPSDSQTYPVTTFAGLFSGALTEEHHGEQAPEAHRDEQEHVGRDAVAQRGTLERRFRTRPKERIENRGRDSHRVWRSRPPTAQRHKEPSVTARMTIPLC